MSIYVKTVKLWFFRMCIRLRRHRDSSQVYLPEPPTWQQRLSQSTREVPRPRGE